MNRGKSIIMGFIITGIILFSISSGSASADNEPDNNNIATAESIGAGTHEGTLDFTDYIDWYKVEDVGDQASGIFSWF